MSDVKIMFSKLMLREEIPVTETDESYRLFRCNAELFHGAEFFAENPDLWDLLVLRSEKSDGPVIYLERGSYAYGVIRDREEGRVYFLGPVLLGMVSRKDLWSYRNITRYFGRHHLMEGMDCDRFLGYVQALDFAARHCWADEQTFLEGNDIMESRWRVSEQEKLQWQVEESGRERKHNSYQMEQLWLDYIKQGQKVEGIPGTMAFDSSIIGEMAKSDGKFSGVDPPGQKQCGCPQLYPDRKGLYRPASDPEYQHCGTGFPGGGQPRISGEKIQGDRGCHHQAVYHKREAESGSQYDQILRRLLFGDRGVSEFFFPESHGAVFL